MNRVMTWILSDDLEGSRLFYTELFDFRITFENERIIQLCVPGSPSLELGLLDREHDIVPESYRTRPKGFLVSLVVDDVDSLYARALAKGLPIVKELCDEEYGQRHFMTQDPNGVLLDINAPIPASR